MKQNSTIKEKSLQPIEAATRSVVTEREKHEPEGVSDERILQALHASNDEVTRAAALLGISRTTLWRKMVKYGLNEGRHALDG